MNLPLLRRMRACLYNYMLVYRVTPVLKPFCVLIASVPSRTDVEMRLGLMYLIGAWLAGLQARSKVPVVLSLWRV